MTLASEVISAGESWTFWILGPLAFAAAIRMVWPATRCTRRCGWW